jgi:hypothetical protein
MGNRKVKNPWDEDVDDPLPSWLFICECGFRFLCAATGDEVKCPVMPCPKCKKEVRGGF